MLDAPRPSDLVLQALSRSSGRARLLVNTAGAVAATEPGSHGPAGTPRHTDNCSPDAPTPSAPSPAPTPRSSTASAGSSGTGPRPAPSPPGPAAAPPPAARTPSTRSTAGSGWPASSARWSDRQTGATAA